MDFPGWRYTMQKMPFPYFFPLELPVLTVQASFLRLEFTTVVCIKLSSTHLHIVDNGYLPVNLTGTEVSLPFCSVDTLRTNGRLFLKHFPSFYEIWNHASVLLCVLFSSWRLLLSWCLLWSWCEQRLLETAVLISWSAFCCLCRTAAPGFRELRQEQAVHNTQIHTVTNGHTHLRSPSHALRFHMCRSRPGNLTPRWLECCFAFISRILEPHICFSFMLLFDCSK